jgi:hypothetical protein
MAEPLAHPPDATYAALRGQADRARFYAHASAHFFRDPEAADRLRAFAVDLERQAATLQRRKPPPSFERRYSWRHGARLWLVTVSRVLPLPLLILVGVAFVLFAIVGFFTGWWPAARVRRTRLYGGSNQRAKR